MAPMNWSPKYHSIPENPRRPGSGYGSGPVSARGVNLSSCPRCHIAVRVNDKHCPNCGCLLGSGATSGVPEYGTRIRDEFPTIPSQPQPRSEQAYKQDVSQTPGDENAYSCPICDAPGKFKSGRCPVCGFMGFMRPGSSIQAEQDAPRSAPGGAGRPATATPGKSYSGPEIRSSTGSDLQPPIPPAPQQVHRPSQPPVENNDPFPSMPRSSAPEPPSMFESERTDTGRASPTLWPKELNPSYGHKQATGKQATQPGSAVVEPESKTTGVLPSIPRSNGGTKVTLGPVFPAHAAPPPPQVKQAAVQQAPQPLVAPEIKRDFERRTDPPPAPEPYRKELVLDGVPATSPWKKHYRESEYSFRPSLTRFIMPAMRMLGVVVCLGLIVFGIVKYAVPWVQSWDLSSRTEAPATAPLTIENVTTRSITDSSAVIAWATSSEATGKVSYGTSPEYGTSTDLSAEPATNHEITLSGLEPETTYYYMIETVDSKGRIQTLSDQTFTTIAAIDSTPPVISDVVFSKVSDVGAVIEWTTDEAATSQVAFGTSIDYGLLTEASDEVTTTHSVTLWGLEPETDYYCKILSLDTEQNEAVYEAAEPLTTATAVPIGVTKDCRASDFTLTTYDGQSITLSDYRGKTVLLNFWTLSCGACLKEMPFLQEAHEKWQDSDVVIIAVNPRDNASQISNKAQELGLTFLIPQDRSKAVASEYKITAIPRTFFIDTTGVIRIDKTGCFQSTADIDKVLNSYDW